MATLVMRSAHHDPPSPSGGTLRARSTMCEYPPPLLSSLKSWWIGMVTVASAGPGPLGSSRSWAARVLVCITDTKALVTGGSWCLEP